MRMRSISSLWRIVESTKSLSEDILRVTTLDTELGESSVWEDDDECDITDRVSSTETVATVCPTIGWGVGSILSIDSLVSGAILTADSGCSSLRCSCGKLGDWVFGLAFDDARDLWQIISRHSSGRSRRNRGWWNAPVSDPRVAWRKPLEVELC